MLKKFLLIFFNLLIILLIYALIPKSVDAVVFFQDNFNNDSAEKWEVARSVQYGNLNKPCYFEEAPAEWRIIDKRLGIKIDGPSCVTEITPQDKFWNSSWNNYIFESDINVSVGVDANIAFRYSGSPNFNWYGYHFEYWGWYDPIYSKIVLQNVLNTNIYQNAVFYDLKYNKTYHLKIVVDGEHIQLFIDGVSTLDYPDAGGRFRTGKIALQASVGSVSKSEVWFDNVKVTSLDHVDEEPVEKIPVVMLPGLGGSWNTTAMITDGSGGDWKKTPYVRVYDNLKNTFLNAGYAENNDYFEFYYDWRQSLENLANQFKLYLENTVLDGKPLNTKVNLVGHSMGGMVARTYAQNYGADKINKLVTSGSPHQGAIPAWMGWSGAEVGDRWSWQWIGLQLYLQMHKGKYASPVAAIRDLAPGLNDLTPIFNFAKDKQDQEIPVTTMDSFNSYLNDLKNSLTAELKSVFNTIAGEEQNPNQDTVEWIKLKDRTLADKLLGRWPDGKPESELYTDEGDLIVLEKSALIDGTSLATVSASHVELVENQAGIQAILNALELNTATVSTAITSPARNPALIFFLHSPANIQVTAPDSSQAGEGINTPMPNSIYSPEDKLLVIYNAVTGNYLANIIGTTDGEYSLDIGQLTENGESWSTVENNIGQGQTNSYHIYFDTNNPQDNPLANPEAKIYLELAKYRLEELKEYVNQLSIKTSYKKYLTSHLNQVIKLVDKGISAYLLNNYNLVRRQTHSALSNNYLLRLIMDMLAERSSINEQTVSYFKTEVNEIGKLLIQAFIKASDQAGVSVSKKLAQKELKEADKKYSQVLSLVVAKVKGENYSAGSSLELNESFLNTAKTGFESGDFNQAYINALVSRIISQELKSMIF